MKFQCPCGAKYAFDVTPEMRTQGITFVCPQCGVDSSAAVTTQLRAAASGPEPLIPKPPTTATTRQVPCPRHPTHHTAERCVVCGHPICQQCMKLFGYVCSAHCRETADRTGIVVPDYALQSIIFERQHQRRITGAMIGIAVGLAILIGGWLWYELVGSQPRPTYSAQLSPPAATGQVEWAGKNQLLVLHGGNLSRHDLGTKSVVWTVNLVNRLQLMAEAQAQWPRIQAQFQPSAAGSPATRPPPPPTLEQVAAELERQYLAELQLLVRGENVWVVQPDKLQRCDWNTGRTVREVPLGFALGSTEVQGDDLVAWRNVSAEQTQFTRLNLANGQVTTNQFRAASSAQDLTIPRLVSALTAAAAPGHRPLDPQRLAQQAQRLPLQGRLALPATISVQQGQNRLLEAMDEMDNGPRPPAPEALPRPPDFSAHRFLFATCQGPVTFTRQLLEERWIEQPDLTPPPRRSALSGPATASAMTEAANELLNQLQRERGGETRREDAGRYRVTLSSVNGDAATWSAEVTGPPRFFALPTVKLIVAGKKVFALDAHNQPLWEHTLNQPLAPDTTSTLAADSGNRGTVCEHDGAVYLTSPGVLTALDVKTGNVRWRLPTVGVSGLFFDATGMLYVNTTTADPERVKFARQIDISQRIDPLILKLNPTDGTILWRAEARGIVRQVGERHLHTIEVRSPDDYEDAQAVFGLRPAAESGYLRVRRLNAHTGALRWDFEEQRYPLDVEIHGNSILLLFPDRLEVRRCLAF